MDQTPTTRRQRGIKASPYKLTHARKAAGFASQAAVAEKIAELEGLENPPKDVVNRAFRGVKVSPDTIERLAVALGVEAHTLLWTADEEDRLSPHQSADEAPPAQRRSFAPGWLAVGLALIGVVLVFQVSSHRMPDAPRPGVAAIPALTDLATANVSLLITTQAIPADDALNDALRRALAAHFALATTAGAQMQDAANTSRGIGTISTTARLTVLADTVGRWSSLTALLEANGVRHQVWAESLPTYRINPDAMAIAARVRTAVLIAIGLETAPVGSYFPLAETQFDVISGMALLDKPPRELDLQRAQSRFEAALRREPDYPQAHAGLCRALLEKYWMLDEARAIEDATMTCDRATELAPTDTAVQLARARLHQVNGRNAEAIAQLEEILAAHPDNADALTMMTVSQITRFQTSGDSSALEQGRRSAHGAAAADPAIWQPYFRLSQIEFLENDLDKAITATRLGLARDENSFLLANLGTYETCVGNFAAAQTAIERAQELAPGAYVGDEFMGQLMYFQGRFEEALVLRKKSIESFEQGEPAFHDMWGSLADAYRQTGDRDNAIEAYRLAVNVVETDLLNKDASQSARAARLYYYARLTELAPDTLSSATLDQLKDELDAVAEAQIEPLGYRYMTLAFALNDRPDDARRFLKKATQRCTGYRQYPDIASLALE